jgi:hypothetical protein
MTDTMPGGRAPGRARATASTGPDRAPPYPMVDEVCDSGCRRNAFARLSVDYVRGRRIAQPRLVCGSEDPDHDGPPLRRPHLHADFLGHRARRHPHSHLLPRRRTGQFMGNDRRHRRVLPISRAAVLPQPRGSAAVHSLVRGRDGGLVLPAPFGPPAMRPAFSKCPRLLAPGRCWIRWDLAMRQQSNARSTTAICLTSSGD